MRANPREHFLLMKDGKGYSPDSRYNPEAETVQRQWGVNESNRAMRKRRSGLSDRIDGYSIAASVGA